VALSENPTTQQLKDLAAQYADVEVTRSDSLNVGNCEGGTDDFIEGQLNGRKSVKVSELVRYIDDYMGIRSVLEYKFRQLEQQAEEKSEEKTEE
jgi:hypothetical protein